MVKYYFTPIMFKEFSEKILKTQKKILGIRVPDMRKTAKEKAKNISFDSLVLMLDKCDKNVYEDVFICGLVISYSKLSDEEKIKATQIYLEFVDSWALIDSAIMTEKTTKSDEKLWKDFVEICIKSDKEFVVRFGVVYMMTNFLDGKNIDFVFENLREIKHSGYYVKMAMAWLYATSPINYFDKTINELQTQNIDVWTVNKSFQKMLESYRICDENKKFIRDLKKQLKNR
jgi:hypothetical protein